MKLPDLPESPVYLLRQWPRGIRVLESVPFRSGYDADSLIALCHWAGMSGPSALRQTGIAYSGVCRLAKLARMDRHGAHYHHSGHVAHVVMAAGLLAAADNLPQSDTNLLLLAALVHDLDHQGYHRSRALYDAEWRSAQMAKAVLLRRGSDARLTQRLERLLLATSFSDDVLRDEILATDRLASYLVDADLFASTFYARGLSMALTGHVKAEDRLTDSRLDLAGGFARQTRNRGFYTAVAADLHAGLPDGYSILSREIV